MERLIHRLRRKKTALTGTKDLAEFYGCDKAGKWDEQNRLLRILMKRRLPTLLYDCILNNPKIPLDSVFSYLRCFRIFEFRLRRNNGELATRLQSLT